ncbi:MAG TPA: VanW family protein [Candidatus Peribacterales bacterium]|nr:VanW family protein [Candidatus Peribacterales bacterium]
MPRTSCLVFIALRAISIDMTQAARRRGIFMTCIFLSLFPFSLLHAAPASLQYQYGEQVFTIEPQKSWLEAKDVPMYRGRELRFATGESLPHGVVMEKKQTWSKAKIASMLDRTIGAVINREAGSVRIHRDTNDAIVFDGLGLNGRLLDLDRTAELTLLALEQNISVIQLPITETEPEVVVEDPELQAMGIAELITIGESDYAGSPKNRIHNIAVGLARFNGQIIPKDEEFSFGKILGPVNAKTGYLPELTILGDKTLPEFGGGLCQVSTTAYRGAWRAGLPITARRNHSYAVRFYFPPGTDATVYPPWTDMRFMNDTAGAILVQTHHENNKAYFLYYGTKPKERSVELVGPFTWDPIAPPPDRIEYTTELPLGESRVLSKRVPGMKAMWYRIITDEGMDAEPEQFASYYEARPYYEEIGMGASPPGIVKTPEKNVIRLSEETTITLPRDGRTGPRIRIRR